MFERDKEELRSLGIPIEVGLRRPRVRGRAGLPRRAVRLRAAGDRPRARGGRRHRAGRPGLAARRARGRDLRRAGQAQGGRRQRRPGGARRRAAHARPRRSRRSSRSGTPPAPARRSRFGYRTLHAATATATRHLQPWGVVSYRGRWYVVGHDTDRDEPRVFRLSRVQGDVRPTASPARSRCPPGTDLRALTESLAPAAGRPHRRGAGPRGRRPRPAPARRAASTGRRRPPGWDRLEVDVRRRPTRSPTRCSATAPTSSSSSPEDVRDARRRAGCGRPRREPRERALMSGARDQVARLLALVPYIQARREVAARRRRPPTSGSARRRSSRTSTCCGSAGCRASAWATSSTSTWTRSRARA